MKIDKSMQEVMGWREKVYMETKNLSFNEKIANFRRTSEKFWAEKKEKSHANGCNLE